MNIYIFDKNEHFRSMGKSENGSSKGPNQKFFAPKLFFLKKGSNNFKSNIMQKNMPILLNFPVFQFP